MRGSGEIGGKLALIGIATVGILAALFVATVSGQERSWDDTADGVYGDPLADWQESEAAMLAEDFFGYDTSHWQIGDWVWFDFWLGHGPLGEPFDPTHYDDDRANWELTGVWPPAWEMLGDEEIEYDEEPIGE